jgi:hypothetical protein
MIIASYDGWIADTYACNLFLLTLGRGHVYDETDGQQTAQTSLSGRVQVSQEAAAGARALELHQTVARVFLYSMRKEHGYNPNNAVLVLILCCWVGYGLGPCFNINCCFVDYPLML